VKQNKTNYGATSLCRKKNTLLGSYIFTIKRQSVVSVRVKAASSVKKIHPARKKKRRWSDLPKKP
jgi:hypothetical protein